MENVNSQTLSEKVREIINMHISINSKVSSSVSSIDKEISLVDENIEKLMNIYVQREIAGNIEGLKEVEESINEAVQNKEKLKLKKEAYERATLNNKALRDKLPPVLALAHEKRDERYKNIEDKRIQIAKLNEDIKKLENEIEKSKNEMYNLQNKSEVRELRPLLQYIEKRKIRALCEEPYLSELISGGIDAVVDQYIEVPMVDTRPGLENICTNIRPHC